MYIYIYIYIYLPCFFIFKELFKVEKIETINFYLTLRQMSKNTFLIHPSTTYNSQKHYIITSATKCYKMNYSIPFTFRFHIVQSIPLTLQVTFIMRESKKVTTK